MAYKKTIRLAPAIEDWTKLKKLPADEKSDALSGETFRKISQAVIDQALTIHYQCFEKFCSTLREQLQLDLSFHSIQAVLLSQQDLVRAMNKEFVVAAACLLVEEKKSYVVFDYPLAQALINRLTGGEGKARIENEELTEMEKSIFQVVFDQLYGCLNEVLKNVIPHEIKGLNIFSPRVRELEGFPVKDDVVFFQAQLRLNNQPIHSIKLVYTSSVLIALMEKWKKTPQVVKSLIQLHPFSLQMVQVPVSANLGKTTLTMKDIIGLQRGDVIVLNKKVDAPCTVAIGADADFLGKVGVVHNKLSIQLLQGSSLSTEKDANSQFVSSSKEKNEYDESLSETEIDTAKETAAEDEQTADQTEEDTDDDILNNIEDIDDDDDDDDFLWDDEEDQDEDF